MEDLTKSPTAIEVAELASAAMENAHHLSKEGLLLLRRILFDRDRLIEENKKMLEALQKIANVASRRS